MNWVNAASHHPNTISNSLNSQCRLYFDAHNVNIWIRIYGLERRLSNFLQLSESDSRCVCLHEIVFHPLFCCCLKEIRFFFRLLCLLRLLVSLSYVLSRQLVYLNAKDSAGNEIDFLESFKCHTKWANVQKQKRTCFVKPIRVTYHVLCHNSWETMIEYGHWV